MGAAGSTVYYNLRLRHPTLDMPLIDYDLALLFQPMLMLGISIGVTFNVMFADWMVTVLLIILFLGNNICSLEPEDESKIIIFMYFCSSKCVILLLQSQRSCSIPQVGAGTSSKALFKAIETWKKETMMKKEAAKQLESESKALGECLMVPSCQNL
ncbi:hypothetical protein CsSME_00003912 [Camellia sinensis var. sinensis]